MPDAKKPVSVNSWLGICDHYASNEYHFRLTYIEQNGDYHNFSIGHYGSDYEIALTRNQLDKLQAAIGAYLMEVDARDLSNAQCTDTGHYENRKSGQCAVCGKQRRDSLPEDKVAGRLSTSEH